MLKAFVSLVIIGVLFQGARSDFQCFTNKLVSMDLTGILRDKTAYCSDVPSLIQTMLKNGEDCSYTFDSDKVKTFLLEFCDDDSELFRSIAENDECLKEKFRGAGDSCSWSSMVSSQESAKESCQKLEHSFFDCYADKVGTACGERALHGVQRILEVPRVLMAGLCDEAQASEDQYNMVRLYVIAGIAATAAICGGLAKLLRTRCKAKFGTRLVETA